MEESNSALQLTIVTAGLRNKICFKDLFLSLANLDQDPRMLSATSCHGSKITTQIKQTVCRHPCEAKKKKKHQEVS